jgi:hypothetical protein
VAALEAQALHVVDAELPRRQADLLTYKCTERQTTKRPLQGVAQFREGMYVCPDLLEAGAWLGGLGLGLGLARGRGLGGPRRLLVVLLVARRVLGLPGDGAATRLLLPLEVHGSIERQQRCVR